MPSILATILLTTLALPSLPTPEGMSLVTDPRGTDNFVFEWSDYAGENATVSARSTKEEARLWCENWRPGDETCTEDVWQNEKDQVHKASANCKTGEITATWGEKYTFAGVHTTHPSFADHYLWRDENGEILELVYATDALTIGSQWRTLCPFGQPYDVLPLDTKLDTNKDYGAVSYIGYENYSMLLFKDIGVVTFTDTEEDFDGLVEHGTVLFRGWWPQDNTISGIAYSYKKGCDPVGYYVEGGNYGQNETITLQGKAPVRGKGCEITGYSLEAPGSELTFHLPQ